MTHAEPEKTPVTNSSTTIIAILLSLAVAFFAPSILLQLVFSFFLFFLLDPIVEWAAERRIPRKLSSIVVVALTLVLSGVTVWGSYGAVAKLAEEVPQYTNKIKKTLLTLKTQSDQIRKDTSELIPQTGKQDNVQKVEVVEKLGDGADQAVIHGVGSVFEILAALFLVPILVLFLLLEKPYLETALARALPRSFRIEYAGAELSQMVTGFFFGNIVVGLLTATGFYVFFAFLKLDNRLLLALLAGFMNLIPMVGAILGGFFPMLQAFLQFEAVAPAVKILIGSVMLHFFVANFVIPKIVGSRINVNATAATMGLIFWGWLWGPLGLLLAVPLTASIRILLASRESTEHLARLIQEGDAGEATRLKLSLKPHRGHKSLKPNPS